MQVKVDAVWGCFEVTKQCRLVQTPMFSKWYAVTEIGIKPRIVKVITRLDCIVSYRSTPSCLLSYSRTIVVLKIVSEISNNSKSCRNNGILVRGYDVSGQVLESKSVRQRSVFQFLGIYEVFSKYTVVLFLTNVLQSFLCVVKNTVDCLVDR